MHSAPMMFLFLNSEISIPNPAFEYANFLTDVTNCFRGFNAEITILSLKSASFFRKWLTPSSS